MKKRVFGLDVLRAYAIFSIMLAHGVGYLPTTWHFLNPLLSFNGVALFFVLSGYLIGGIIIRSFENNTFQLKEFWIRRWFRTLPNYFLIVLVTSLIFRPSITTLWPYLCFLQNLDSPHPPFFAESWSLCVEEWFYVTFPVVLLSLQKIVKKPFQQTLLLSIITFIVLGIVFRTYKSFVIEYDSVQEWDALFRKQVLTRLDSIIFGVLGAYYYHYLPHKWKSNKVIKGILGASLLAVFQLDEAFHFFSYDSTIYSIWYFNLQAIGWLLVFPLVEIIQLKNNFLRKTIQLTSKISYGMYLLNFSLISNNLMPYIKVLTDKIHLSAFNFFFFYGLTFIMAWVLYIAFEHPCTNLRDYFSQNDEVAPKRTHDIPSKKRRMSQ